MYRCKRRYPDHLLELLLFPFVPSIVVWFRKGSFILLIEDSVIIV